MARAKNPPNTLLRALLEESRWTNHNLAHAVNRIGAESGVALHYDRTTVSHWLSGSRPRRPVPTFVAEAFSRRLRRSVPVVETGLVDVVAGATGPPGGDRSAVAELLDLVMDDLRPGTHRSLAQAPYRVDWPLPPDRPSRAAPPASGHHASPRLDRGDIEAVRMMTLRFAEADNAFGGGHGRSALAAYLATDVATWLRARASDPVRLEMLGATARLVHLIGFMCFDNLRHHLAQRYFHIALRLVGEANDPVGHATVLRSMIMQAQFLGHHRRAVEIADEAVHRVSALPPSRTSAALLGQAAITHAAVREARTAKQLMAKAETHLDAPVTPATPEPVSRADVTHQAGQTLALLHDDAAAERALHESLRHRGQAERRSRMLTMDQLAELQLRRGRVEQACETWQTFLADYPVIHSGRITGALGRMRRQLLPHRTNRAVRQTLIQANRLTERHKHP